LAVPSRSPFVAEYAPDVERCSSPGKAINVSTCALAIYTAHLQRLDLR